MEVARFFRVPLSMLTSITSNGRGYARISAAASVIDLPSLSTIEQVVFYASEGGSVQATKTASDYDSRDFWSDGGGFASTYNWTLMQAEGAGSLLDLSAVQLVDAGFDTTGVGNDTNIQHIVAQDGGTIDLSGVETITTPNDIKDRIEFNASGSTIDLSSLHTIDTAGSGSLLLTVDLGGTITTGGWSVVTAPATVTINNADPVGEPLPTTTLHVLGDLKSASTVVLDLLHPNTWLDVDGSIFANADFDFNAPTGGLITVGQRFCFSHGNEDDLELADATVHFDGAGILLQPQRLEVGGFDIGIDFPCDSFDNDNFGIGQLIIGADDQPTIVELRDDMDNGNTGGGNTEALYLFGPDALQIRNGSTLIINELNLYLCETQTSIKEMFAKGVDEIPFDEGFIRMGALPVVGDINGDGSVNASDLLELLAAWGDCPAGGYCPADIVCDGSVNATDLLELLANWN